MGKITILYEEEEVTVEHRTVQDFFIQWNKPGEPDWAKMIKIGLPFIIKTFKHEMPLVIDKTEAGSYMVSCNDWVGMSSELHRGSQFK